MSPEDRELHPERPGRRAWLKGAFGGIAAWTAAAVARVDPLSAAAGDPILAGRLTDAGSAQTTIKNDSNTNATVYAQNNGTNAAIAGNSGRGWGGVFRTARATRQAVLADAAAIDGVAILARNTSTGTGYSAGSGIRALSGGGSVDDIHPNGTDWDAAGEFAGPNGIIASTNAGGYGVIGHGEPDGWGVWGSSETGVGVQGAASGVDGTGVQGTAAEGGTGVRGIADTGAGVAGYGDRGVAGHSPAGSGVHATTSTGAALYAEAPGPSSAWAAWMEGRTHVSGYIEVDRIPNPSSPIRDAAILWVRTNASGKRQLCVIFPSGPAQVIATEP